MARALVRLREIEQSFRILDEVVAKMPAGPVAVPIKGMPPVGEAWVRIEQPRGEVLYFVRVQRHSPARAFPRPHSHLREHSGHGRGDQGRLARRCPDDHPHHRSLHLLHREVKRGTHTNGADRSPQPVHETSHEALPLRGPARKFRGVRGRILNDFPKCILCASCAKHCPAERDRRRQGPRDSGA